MNYNHEQVRRKELRKQLDYIERVKNDTSYYSALLSYMMLSAPSRMFFEKCDEEKLFREYESEVKEVSINLGMSEYSPKEKILNFLEYIRMTVGYENVLVTTDEMHKMAGISQSPVNAALLGKGVCASQAKFLEDLLLSSGFEEDEARSQVVWVRPEDEPLMRIAEHLVVLVHYEGEWHYFDPTAYNGSLEIFEYSFKICKVPDFIKLPKASKEEIEVARERVTQYLIRKLGIADISEDLKISGLSDLEKQIRFMIYLKKHLSPPPNKIKYRSVVFGTREVEVGKFLELLYFANDIPCEVIVNGNRNETTYYNIVIDGKKIILFPGAMFDVVDGHDQISKSTSFVKDGTTRALINLEELPELKQLCMKYLAEAERVVK